MSSQLIEKLKADLGELWIPEIYREKVRTKRTRSFALAPREREQMPQIHHTLLGIELQMGKLRLAIPDLATARYLRVFARIGCREIAVPYDISKISMIADLFETAWQRLELLLRESPSAKRREVIKFIRNELAEAGAGEIMPAFDTPTRRIK